MTNLELNLHSSDEHGSNYLGMEIATATRLVNDIGRVYAAAPGILSPFDLGLEKNVGTVRPNR